MLLLIYCIVWSTKLSTRGGRGYIRAASTTLINHLRNCPHQTLETKTRAVSHREATSPQKNRTLLSTALETNAGPSINTELAPMQITGSSGSLPPSPSPSALAFLNVLPFSGSINSTSSISLNSPTTSSSSSHLSLGHLATNQHTVQSRLISSQLATSKWTKEQQDGFEIRLARATASAGLPLAWVDNPDVEDLFEFLQPAANLPSRKVLTNRIIPRAVDEFRQWAKAEAKGYNATLESDGWTGVNHHHFISFMISVNGKVSKFKSRRAIRTRPRP